LLVGELLVVLKVIKNIFFRMHVDRGVLGVVMTVEIYLVLFIGELFLKLVD
jgi:hypothetical protein